MQQGPAEDEHCAAIEEAAPSTATDLQFEHIAKNAGTTIEDAAWEVPWE